jgi:cytochrome b involved in lipid metabolism
MPLTQVRQHNTPEDAWMVYRNKVYDVSSWREHPGGNVIFTHAGDDCTDIFAAFHPPSASTELEPFYIGELDAASDKKAQSQRDFEKAYRDLRGKLVTMGLFKARWVGGYDGGCGGLRCGWFAVGRPCASGVPISCLLVAF